MQFQYWTGEIFQNRLQVVCTDILRKEGRAFPISRKRGDFYSWFFSMHLNNLQLDALRQDPEQSFDFWPIMAFYNFYFIFPSPLLSLYRLCLFVCFCFINQQSYWGRPRGWLLADQSLHNAFCLLGVLDSLHTSCGSILVKWGDFY